MPDHDTPSTKTLAMFDDIRGEITEIKSSLKNLQLNGKKSVFTKDGFSEWLKNNVIQLIILTSILIGSYYGLQSKISLLQKDIQQIKENDVFHLTARIELNEKLDEKQEMRINEIFIKLERLITILEKR